MQNVLDSLIPALLADKNRKFIYVEQVTQTSFSIWFFLVIVMSLGVVQIEERNRKF